MHRILLFALVGALLYSSWDARRGEALAKERLGHGAGAVRTAQPEHLLARAEPEASTARPDRLLVSRTSLADRLEARVESDGGAWTGLDLQVEPGPPPEEVLADAERWMESKFPEGGHTRETAKDERAPAPAAPWFPPAPTGAVGEPDASPATVPEQGPREEGPIYVATLARIECMSGEVPAWCGLLDLSLRPATRRGDVIGLETAGGAALGETAWICDDQGKLLARVEALDGFGLELDPTWPWSLRQRRLFWTEGGASGMPIRQYRLMLEGGGLGPSWTGRLVLVHTRPPTHR